MLAQCRGPQREQHAGMSSVLVNPISTAAGLGSVGNSAAQPGIHVACESGAHANARGA